MDNSVFLCAFNKLFYKFLHSLYLPYCSFAFVFIKPSAFSHKSFSLLPPRPNTWGQLWGQVLLVLVLLLGFCVVKALFLLQMSWEIPLTGNEFWQSGHFWIIRGGLVQKD